MAVSPLSETKVPGTFTWKIYWDPNGGTNYTKLDTYDGMEAQHGSAQGEISKQGPTADALNDEWDLKWKDSSGSYSDWADQNCYHTGISAWHWHQVNNTEFTIVSGNGACSS